MNTYMINAISYYEQNQKILQHYYDSKAAFFTKNENIFTFTIEISMNEKEEQKVKDLALHFKKIYNISTIQIWEKSPEYEGSGSYDIGILILNVKY